MLDWSTLGSGCSGLVYGFLSALFPLVNSEAYALSVAAVSDLRNGIVVAVALSCGQTLGKVILFLAARHGSEMFVAKVPALRRYLRHAATESESEAGAEAEAEAGSGAEAGAEAGSESGSGPVGRWRGYRLAVGRFVKRMSDYCLTAMNLPWAAVPILLLSSLVGIPPLLVTAVVAGRSRMSLTVFVPTVLIGRTLRFGLMMVPVLLATR